jgi:hypothetical protein
MSVAPRTRRGGQAGEAVECREGEAVDLAELLTGAGLHEGLEAGFQEAHRRRLLAAEQSSTRRQCLYSDPSALRFVRLVRWPALRELISEFLHLSIVSFA